MDQHIWLSWLRTLTDAIPEPVLHGVGLILLADLPALAKKTALWGPSALRDAFLLAPGLHKQQKLSSLSDGEYPACAAMTTGYVFRVENEAMVHHMQRHGRPGQLTTLSVSAAASNTNSSAAAQLLYAVASFATILVISSLIIIEDHVILGAVLGLVAVSITNTLLIKSRAKLGWKGQKEPGVMSDLLVLLSQDRWIRMQGLTDDVKVVSSGQWLRQQTVAEELVSTIITVVVHISAGAIFAASPEGKLLFFLLITFNSVVIEVANALTDQLSLYGRVIKIAGERKSYGRRLELAEELVQETGNDSWCEKMGIILTKHAKSSKGSSTGPAHM